MQDLILTKEEEQRLLDFKNDMHMHPELSHREYETTKKIREFLATIPGVEILSLNRELTGVVARIQGLKEPDSFEQRTLGSEELHGDGQRTLGSERSMNRQPEVALRADIDAIAQTERWESPYASKNEGVMHACGHDFHTASLLGSALLLSKYRTEWSGTVDLLFQEAEETTDGAKEMLDAGLLDIIRPQMFFGMHNRPEVEAGKVVCHPGGLMACKTNFVITIYGKGGHGGNPHMCVDPIVCAAALIQSLQTIVSRNTDPLQSVVMTIGSIHGGSVENLVVDEVRMTASVRALSMEAKEKAVSRAEEIIRGTASAYGCTSEIEYKEILPLIDNRPAMYALAKKAAIAAVGEENVTDAEPTMASEDFSLIMEQIPSFFYWIGSGTQGETCYAWHSDRFHTNDAGIKSAAVTMTQAALHGLDALKTSFCEDA